MTVPLDLLWRPLLEASAQVIVGTIGGYAFAKAVEKLTRRNSFDGPMDLWKRGIEPSSVQEGDQIYIDCLVSPYSQLFPGNPYQNGKKWNKLYEFEGKISSEEYQALDFFAGSDAALRIGSLNGETVLGIYARYGYVGEGILGVAPTSLIRKVVPEFFAAQFFGARAAVGGKLARCPTQHGFVAQAIADKAGINVGSMGYKDLHYLQINSIKLFNKTSDKFCSLIGSPWAVTSNKSEQYLVQYGYFDNKMEIETCIDRIKISEAWREAEVFFDDITSPSEGLSFRKRFII